MGEFTRLLGEAEKSERETKNLYQRLSEYQDYARRIGILDAELSRLELLNGNLEEDNKNMRLKYAAQIAAENREEHFQLLIAEKYCLVAHSIWFPLHFVGCGPSAIGPTPFSRPVWYLC